MKKKGPYLLIAALILILFFIGGVQYGKAVEKTNKAIETILSTTPAPSNITSQPKNITFSRFEHKECGVSFVYPSLLSVVNESSTGARLANKTITDKIDLVCGTDFSEDSVEGSQATSSALISGVTASISKLDNNVIKINITHPKTGQKIRFKLNNELEILLKDTLIFL
ncbi:hypothetical protein A3A93_04790 [Candidatus Roizmanbacteria bacterium RIFCSPLOWO2_01_FULL_38_12]|uniref:Uncharacterized protein n=1 Tax=Candidatus Roizmanbacteria bacterium RIFCSPLOWO2_01_FULL_38_12 TaxID=1802061 RepID=A0A1F7IVY6_9BACT|nr:MAG: hypothetical protein A3F59_06040 [Candidatus Roizmanbacteria bacterium RIFCSPHIGHO2_12_FULL_38_13]OGK47526.1 MAG: hypothetical protein A3A93_04790 [Candidatus Roizmanbacteria bacterium RIFCSPLOWO2_01_FULL_38_12]